MAEKSNPFHSENDTGSYPRYRIPGTESQFPKDKSLKIYYVSDLHFEFQSAMNFSKYFSKSEKKNSILCICGDSVPVCLDTAQPLFFFRDFVSQCSRLFNYVFIVSGNHEYYSDRKAPMEFIEYNLRNFCGGFPNVFYLQRNGFIVELFDKRYLIIGATLWTEMNDAQCKLVRPLMNDYNQILFSDGNNFTPYHANLIHAYHIRFINQTIEAYKNQVDHIIVMTHHKPYDIDEFGTLASERKPGTKFAYMSDAVGKITEKNKKIFWFYGHTHVPDMSSYENFVFFSNPFGYPFQKTGFKKDCYVAL